MRRHFDSNALMHAIPLPSTPHHHRSPPSTDPYHGEQQMRTRTRTWTWTWTSREEKRFEQIAEHRTITSRPDHDDHGDDHGDDHDDHGDDHGDDHDEEARGW